MNTNDNKKRPVRKASQPKKRSQANVVYTEPKVFNRNRFLLQLLTVVAVVVALLLGLSIFFKMQNVVVSGAEKYSAWQVKEASGLQDGENLLTINATKVSARIRSNLPYVNSVRVGIKLPDTVCIEIKELDVVYAAESVNGKWWLVDSAGNVVDSVSVAESKGYTKILGVQLESPAVGKVAVASEPQMATETTGETEETQESSAPAVVTVSSADRLNAALAVAQALENNGLLGQIATIDVTSIGSIEMWYGERYQVLVGDTQRLDYKVEAMKLAIQQSSGYQSGILDVSFTIWPDQVGYTPFN